MTTTAEWPIRRHDDPEMHTAVVTGIAQYILRGWAHRTRPGHTPAEVLARTLSDLAEAEGAGYTFTAEASAFAVEAEALAENVRDHDPNWDDWAFGH